MPRVWKVLLLLGLMAACTGEVSWGEPVRPTSKEEQREEDEMLEDLEIVKELEMLQTFQILQEMEILGELESFQPSQPEQGEGTQ
ncbi:MAG: hypothetical protein O6929_12990 [candidate division NC10 bacterium]|nr:hypothetical protein [candidate division NC10 bacterium]